MRADVLQRGVSDHIRGRGLGRPRGHFGWSLTPRDCCWRPLWPFRHQAGGTERRPRRTGRKLHDVRQLPDVLTVRESGLIDQEISSMRPTAGGTPRAHGVFPPVFPLEALIDQRSLDARPAVANEI